jgi:murein DD-endopeptidase MepM/ murein hydrolase activator NlpD
MILYIYKVLLHKNNEVSIYRLIKPIAQDPSGDHTATYHQSIVHVISFGLLSLIGIVGLFNSTPSSAESFLKGKINDTTNSQTVSLLSPNYSLEIPQATGGPNDIIIHDRLALLSPQVGMITGYQALPNIEVDPFGIITYIVQKGDTLSEIAEKFDVSANTIRWENDLGKTLSEGKDLQILPVTGVRHTIAKGDTFAKIAKTYDVEAEDITVFNNIDDTKLLVGNKIIVPNGIKREAVAVTKSNTSSSSSLSILATLSSARGEYIRPTTGVLTSKMGPRNGSFHYGIDYGAPTGTPIVATAAGTVIKTSCGSGYGKCMIIQHANGTQSLYAHTSQLFVTTGTKVKQGQRIAAVGSTGRSTGPHLHFEIRDSLTGRALNPLNLIK